MARQGARDQAEIDALREAKDAAEARAQGFNNTGPRTSRRVAKGRRDAALVQMVEYGAEIDERIAALSAVLEDISRAIALVGDSELRLLLVSRYVLFKKWVDIALAMGYSYTNVTYMLHPKALKAAAGHIGNAVAAENKGDRAK